MTFDYRRRFREIEDHMKSDALKRWHSPSWTASRLAEAMLDSKNGVAGARDSKEQLELTIRQAEWLIARLPFHGLAIVPHEDGLSDDERQARYSDWLRSGR